MYTEGHVGFKSSTVGLVRVGVEVCKAGRSRRGHYHSDMAWHTRLYCIYLGLTWTPYTCIMCCCVFKVRGKAIAMSFPPDHSGTYTLNTLKWRPAEA